MHIYAHISEKMISFEQIRFSRSELCCAFQTTTLNRSRSYLAMHMVYSHLHTVIVEPQRKNPTRAKCIKRAGFLCQYSNLCCAEDKYY